MQQTFELAVSGQHREAADDALIVERGAADRDAMRLQNVLKFFGVPCERVSAADLARMPQRFGGVERYAVFAAIDVLGDVMADARSANIVRSAVAIYTHTTADFDASNRGLTAISGREWSLHPGFEGMATFTVTEAAPKVTGAMSGLTLKAPTSINEATLARSPDASSRVASATFNADEMQAIVAVNGRPAFARFAYDGVPIYVCASGEVVDLDQPVRQGFFDVKDHFLEAVPLVMFITATFRDVMWVPQEHGACVIIDDPLLKRRYGFCDFTRLCDDMRRHDFTTNIAFIPWNWRRTTRSGGELFRRNSDVFSVSIHGCDHVKAEFAGASAEAIETAASLAQTRMRRHQDRTSIQHDPVMVFPQGIFSSICPGILKRTGFIAAINTEVSPVDGEKTLLRDVWDVAILRYGSFPVYTRRYEHHGLENFTFDLLLGKPCFIVAHHDFFSDKGARLLHLVARLSELNQNLRWRSPAEVIRRSCRWRTASDGVVEFEMYGTEMIVPRSPNARSVRVRKRETDAAAIADILCNGSAVPWDHGSGHVQLKLDISATTDTLVSLRYKPTTVRSPRSLSLRAHVAIAARRFLSEIRDEVIHKVLVPH